MNGQSRIIQCAVVRVRGKPQRTTKEAVSRPERVDMKPRAWYNAERRGKHKLKRSGREREAKAERRKRQSGNENRTCLKSSQFPVVMTKGSHLFPYRTQQLSPSVPMVLGWRRPGRVGRCRNPFSSVAQWQSTRLLAELL